MRPFPQVPPFIADPVAKKYLEDLRAHLLETDKKKMNTDLTFGYFHLSAPDGSTWKVTIDDTGVLTTEKVFG